MREAVNLPSGMRGAARLHAWLILLGLSVMFCLSVLWRPSDDGIILCPFRALTGYPCPGCGMTRAFSALAHGEPMRAVLYNPLSPILFLAAIILWMSAAATLLNLHGVRMTLARLRPTTQVSYMFLGLMLTWWIVRLAGGF